LIPDVLFLSVPLLAFAVTFGIIYWMLSNDHIPLILDHPNARSLHVSPTPRTGGLAIMCAVLFAGGLAVPQEISLLACIAGLALVSFFDDWRGLPITLRFAAHVIITSVFVGISFPDAPLLVFLLIVLGSVWMVNLYNFMDGSDGLAGGMALIGFSAYGIAALFAQSNDLSAFSFSIAASSAAFLLYNVHPAKIFLGDVGSIPLGFAASSIGLLGWNRGIWPLWFPLLVFSPFIVDATLTLAKRCARREKVWKAHRDHYYQRIVRMGWGHSKTALVEYGLMACVGSCALMALRWSPSMQVVLLVGWAFVYLGIAFSLDRAWRRYQSVQAKAD
jgi:UDP-GlcNAc:undecaprenyl-phosphate/decaprenyl-phosphate GlcNAc-1-phosphate transferase